MALAPHTYLRLRRKAAGLSLDDVAAKITTEPHLPHRERVVWLEQIEAGVAPIALTTIVTLQRCFDFDVLALLDLAEAALGLHRIMPIRICRVCGCGEDDPCVSDETGPCRWVGKELCSACAPDAPADPSSEPTQGASA